QQGERPRHFVLERALPETDDRGGDDCEHGWLQSFEHGRNPFHVAVRHVKETQRPKDDGGRQHEERAGDDAAPGAVQQPAGVGRQLRRLRPGQQHAIVECVEEPLLADPAALFDQFSVEDGDLSGRPAEADESQLEPEAERLGKSGVTRVGGLHYETVRTSLAFSPLSPALSPLRGENPPDFVRALRPVTSRELFWPAWTTKGCLP